MKIISVLFLLLIQNLIYPQSDTEWFRNKYPNSKIPQGISTYLEQQSVNSLNSILEQKFEEAIMHQINLTGNLNKDSIELHVTFLESIYAYNELLKNTTPTSDQHYYYAYALRNTNQLDHSIFSCTQALSIYDPNRENLIKKSVIFYTRGIVKYEKGDYYGSISDLTTAIELGEYLAATHSYRGRAYYMTNSYSEALKDLNKAIEQQPMFDYQDYFYRGHTFLALNKKSDACKDFSTIGDLGYNNDDLLNSYCH